MNALGQDQRLKISLLVVIFVWFIFFPSVFYYGILGVLTLGFAWGTIHYLSAVFHSRALHWGSGTRLPMSRRSRFLIGLLLAVVTAYIVMRVVVKLPDTEYLFSAFVALMLLVFLSRWLDARGVS